MYMNTPLRLVTSDKDDTNAIALTDEEFKEKGDIILSTLGNDFEVNEIKDF